MTTFKLGGIADAGPAIIIGLLIGLVAAQIMPSQTHTQPVSAAVSEKYDGDCTGNETAGRCADKPLLFDHSQCQYPDRTTNPPNGCDNTDPCDPANTKGGSGECSPATITPAPAKATECEGK